MDIDALKKRVAERVDELSKPLVPRPEEIGKNPFESTVKMRGAFQPIHDELHKGFGCVKIKVGTRLHDVNELKINLFPHLSVVEANRLFGKGLRNNESAGLEVKLKKSGKAMVERSGEDIVIHHPNVTDTEGRAIVNERTADPSNEAEWMYRNTVYHLSKPLDEAGEILEQIAEIPDEGSLKETASRLASMGGGTEADIIKALREKQKHIFSVEQRRDVHDILEEYKRLKAIHGNVYSHIFKRKKE